LRISTPLGPELKTGRTETVKLFVKKPKGGKREGKLGRAGEAHKQKGVSLSPIDKKHAKGRSTHAEKKEIESGKLRNGEPREESTAM